MRAAETAVEKLRDFLGPRALWELDEGTLVAIPSVSLGANDLIAKMGDPRRFDERLLFLLLMLKSTRLKVCYVTSQPLPGDVVEHYLGCLPDPQDARRRLNLISLDDARHKPLAQKILGHPSAVEAIKASIEDPQQACIVPMDVTPAELVIAGMLDVPVYGPAAEFAHLGTKSGSRMVAKAAGIPIVPGRENLCDRQQLREAAAAIQKEVPGLERVIFKLDEGFSGEGNAIVDLTDDSLEVILGGHSLDWPGFLDKMQEGGVAEAFIDDGDLRCPSVQISISPKGRVEVLATQEQVLGGPSKQAFAGCRFPADPDYRPKLHDLAVSAASYLSAHGVHGIFGFDFLAQGAPGGARTYLSEINLRMGGATAPCFLARLLTGATYDAQSGSLRLGESEIRYLSRERVASPAISRSFSDLRRQLDAEGLSFDQGTSTGIWPHVCTALDRGEVGYIVFACSEQEITRLDGEMLRLLSIGSSNPT